MQFVRKNIIVLTGTFSLPGDDGAPATVQPSAVTAVLSYKNTLGQAASATISMTMDGTTKVWSGSWDSSAAEAGRVEWMVYSTGSLVAADEGFFETYANDANKV